jgi:hypothetical protein
MLKDIRLLLLPSAVREAACWTAAFGVANGCNDDRLLGSWTEEDAALAFGCSPASGVATAVEETVVLIGSGGGKEILESRLLVVAVCDDIL